MASWNVARFGSSKKMTDFLNGRVIGNVNLLNGADVDGLTFIFDKGGGDVTVTFTAKGRVWTINEIVDQINVTEAGLAHIDNVGSTPPDRRLAIEKDLASLTVKSSGTANSLLGFSTTTDQVSDRVVDTEVFSAGPEPGEQSWVVVRYA